MKEQLRKKLEIYLALLPKVQDHRGFIHTDKCDSLMMTSLLGTCKGVKVDIDAAFDKDTGQWHRRPLCYFPCYPAESKSSISRDMLLGLLYFSYFNKRLDIIEQVIKYALSHHLIMGKGKISRTFLTPNLLSTYALVCKKLGGKDYWWLTWIPSVESKFVTGFQAQLSVLHILLRGIIGDIRNTSILKYHMDRVPKNALFNFAYHYFTDKNYNKAIELLLDEKWFPSNRLPTNYDRDVCWMFEHDYTPNNIEPVKEGKPEIWSGGDLIFLANLILNQED
jgi:hypothetical protein